MPAPHTSHELQLADSPPNGGGCGCGGCGCGSNTETGSSTGTTIESTATAATKGNEMTTTSYDVTGNYVLGANVAGFMKVANAMMDQGLV